MNLVIASFEPVLAPLPDVAVHVVQTKAIGLVRAYLRSAAEHIIDVCLPKFDLVGGLFKVKVEGTFFS